MALLCYFVRHGQTDWNTEGRLQGQADTMLNERGRAQADRNGRHLSELLRDPESFEFVASPLGRTRATMERLRAAMGLAPGGYRTDGRLVEVHFGDWQGLTHEELEARQPGCTRPRLEDKWGFCPPGPGAESYAMLAERVRPWFESLARPTVCVTHGGIMRAALYLGGFASGSEAAALDIPQDRIMRIADGWLDWL